MARLTLEPLATMDAHAYWQVYIAGRSDLPSRSLKVHLDRYLTLPPEEQRTYFAFREDGRIIGTARFLPGTIAGFSMDPDRADRTTAALVKAVDFLRAQGAGAIAAYYEERYGPAFTALGFRRRFARRLMVAPVAKGPLPSDVRLKPPEEGEVLRLTSFLKDAYQGHVEQAFGMHTGSEEEWRQYVGELFKGGSGQYLPDASFVALEADRVVGAIVVTYWMGAPLVAELGVAKDRRGRGLGRALLQAAMNRLADRGESQLALFVTVGNNPAIRLYGSMGFVQVGGETVTARLE